MDYDVARSRAVSPLFYHAPCPDSQTPFPYQLAGAEYHLERDNALFGDPPGLGKTIECILVGNAIGASSTIVVCPASLRLNWEREIWRWSTIPNVSTYPVMKSSNGVNLKANYVIISYALLGNPGIFRALKSRTWDHLILDEAHYLKSPEGNLRTSLICGRPGGLAEKVGRITMASGTIVPNRPLECYNAIRLLNWGAIDKMSMRDFKGAYYTYGEGFTRVTERVDGKKVSKINHSFHVLNVPCNLDDLQFRLRKNIMVRRAKELVLPQLPTRQWHVVPLEKNRNIKNALAHEGWKKAEQLYEIDVGVPGVLATGVDGAISTARRLLGEAKAPLAAEYILDLLDSGAKKIIVSAWHLSVLSFLREKLAKEGVAYMDGSTTPVNKQKSVDLFLTSEKIKIMLGQMMPLGEGWNLECAQDVVIVEPDWVPGRNDQMLDRAHRIGQKGDYVIGHLVVVAHSLESKILERIVDKSKAIYATLDHEQGVN